MGDCRGGADAAAAAAAAAAHGDAGDNFDDDAAIRQASYIPHTLYLQVTYDGESGSFSSLEMQIRDWNNTVRLTSTLSPGEVASSRCRSAPDWRYGCCSLFVTATKKHFKNQSLCELNFSLRCTVYLVRRTMYWFGACFFFFNFR